MKVFLAPIRWSTSTTVRLVAIAPRVANVTESTVATRTSASTASPPRNAARPMERMCSTKLRWSSRLAVGTCSDRSLASCWNSGTAPDVMRTTARRGTGSSSSTRPVPSQGSSRCEDSSFEKTRTSATPGKRRATSAARRTSASRLRLPTGRTWIVTSRATSDCQSLAAARTRTTAPVVSEARKVMIATIATSARPAIVPLGTIGVTNCGSAPGCGAAVTALISSFIDMNSSFVQHQPARVVLVHERDIVRGDDDRGTGLVELDKQSQQALREARIDVAGRLVGEQKLGPCDHRARNRGALLFSARQHRRQRPHPLAKPDPLQQLDHFIAEVLFFLPDDAQWQCHVLIRRHMVDQPKILEYDTDAPPQRRHSVLVERGDVVAEQGDQPARRAQRQEQQAHEGGLAGARWPGQKLE